MLRGIGVGGVMTKKVRFWLIVLVLVLAAVCATVKWGVEPRFVVKEDHSLTMNIAAGDPDGQPPSSFWFALDGRLITVWERGSCVFVRRDDLDAGNADGIERRRLDFARLAANPEQTVQEWLPQRSERCDPDANSGNNPQAPETTGETFDRSLPVYAISETGDQFLWMWDQALYLIAPFDLHGSQQVRDLELGQARTRLPIQYLAFIRPSLIGFIDEDGGLGFWQHSPDSSHELAFGTRFQGPAPLQARSGVLAVAVFDAGDIGVVHYLGAEGFQLRMYRPPFSGGSVLGLSPSAMRIAVGSSGGSLWREDLNQVAASGPSQVPAGPSQRESNVPDAIGALAFIDEERVLVGGDFEGLWLVDWHGEAKQAYGKFQGVRKLAASREHIAYATATAFKVASYREAWRPNGLGLGIIFGGFLPGLLFFLLSKWSSRRERQ